MQQCRLDRRASHTVTAIRNRLATRFRQSPFCTDFNLLRWYQEHGTEAETAAQLNRHLQLRHALNLDDMERRLPPDELTANYTSCVVVGPTGVSNGVLMCEIGNYDFAGLLKSLQYTSFLLQRFVKMEQAMRQVALLEASTGRQAHVVYLLDMEGMRIGTDVTSFVSGPLRLLGRTLLSHFPALIQTVVIVNAPTGFGLLWATARRFLPPRDQARVVIAPGGDLRAFLLPYVADDRLPHRFGGQLPDGGLRLPPGRIPSHLFWTRPTSYPQEKSMWRNTISTKKTKYCGFEVTQAGARMHWFVQCAQDYTFGIYYAADKHAQPADFDEQYMDLEYPSLSSTDAGTFVCERAGCYYFKLGTKKGGLFTRPIKLFYHAEFTSAAGAKIDCKRLPKLTIRL